MYFVILLGTVSGRQTIGPKKKVSTFGYMVAEYEVVESAKRYLPAGVPGDAYSARE